MDKVFTISDVPEEIKKYIKNATDKKGNLSSSKLQSMSSGYKAWFEAYKNVISPRALFNLMKNKLDSIPFCRYCHKIQLTPYQYEKKHYFCCNQHAQLDKSTQDKTKNTFEKYEGGHPLKDKAIREKILNTNIQRYGTSVVCNTPENQQKRKEICLKKYGVEHSSQSQEVQKRRIETYRKKSIEKYGVPNPSQSPEIKTKILYNHKITMWGKMQVSAKIRGFEFISTLNDY